MALRTSTLRTQQPHCTVEQKGGGGRDSNPICVGKGQDQTMSIKDIKKRVPEPERLYARVLGDLSRLFTQDETIANGGKSQIGGSILPSRTLWRDAEKNHRKKGNSRRRSYDKGEGDIRV